MSKRLQQLELAAVLGREYPDWRIEKVAQVASKLIDLSAVITRLGVKECNEPLSAREDATLHDTIALARRWTREIFGVEALVAEDPRGFAIKVILPSGRYNNMGGQGWGI